MDPDACWNRITALLIDREWEDVTYACDNLIGWLEKGGYTPGDFASPEVAMAVTRAVRGHALQQHEEGA